MATNTLSLEQQIAFEKFTRGENLFITGPGGTGKTKLIEHFVKHAEMNKKKCQVCALTGCASLILPCKARTIHSWSGIKVLKGNKQDVIRSVLHNKNAMNSWKKINILIVDEVSMMSKKIFDILEELACISRANTHPFGGIQVVFVGDFFQLPPVSNGINDGSDKFCFESSKWFRVFPMSNHVELKTIFRQSDPEYIEILLEIRKGTISEKNIQILQKYIRRTKPEDFIFPIKLFPVKNKVNFINQKMFDKIEDEVFHFECIISTDLKTYVDTGFPFPLEVMERCKYLNETQKKSEIEKLTKENISLKKGANVMCTYNLDMDNGICNGSQGVVIDFLKQSDKCIPVVKFYNGIVMNVGVKMTQSDDFPCIAVGQIPLCLSWAMTIHKIQGSTINSAEIDVGNSIFEYGQIYVALSRIKSLDGLYLLNFNPNKIKANPKVIDFYQNVFTSSSS